MPPDAPKDTIPIGARDIEREARWLREAGHTFPASLLEALWAELQDAGAGRPSVPLPEPDPRDHDP